MSIWKPKPHPPVPARAFAVEIPPTAGTVTISGAGTDGNDWSGRPIPLQDFGDFARADFPALRGDVMAVNLWIETARYEIYHCVIHVPPNVNATAAIDLPILGNRYIPHGVNGSSCLPHLVPKAQSAVVWPIHRDGLVLKQQDGALFPWLGLSAFPLYLKYLQGDSLAVIDDWLRVVPNATMLRVFGMVNSFAHLWPQEHPDYYDKLRPFADYLRTRWNLGLEFTIFADAGTIMPTASTRRTHALNVITALVGVPNGWVEVANEPMVLSNLPGGEQEAHDLAVLIAGNGPLVASGAYTQAAVESGWCGPDYVTIHPPRDAEWYRKGKDVLDVRDATHLPTINDEHIGLAEVARPGSRTDNPDECGTCAAVSHAHGAGSTIHSDAGIDGLPFGPVQAACAARWSQAAAWMPREAQLAPYVRGDASSPCTWAFLPPGVPSPTQHRDDVDLRSYLRLVGNAGYVVQCHVPGHPYRGTPTLCPGWVIDQAGPSVGLTRLIRS